MIDFGKWDELKKKNMRQSLPIVSYIAEHIGNIIIPTFIRRWHSVYLLLVLFVLFLSNSNNIYQLID